MKIFSLISLLVLVWSNNVLAQNCTPDNTITAPGVYPEQPDTAYAGTSYEFVFQILALKDTNTTFGGQPITAEIDSVNVLGVIGLPAGFSYGCEPGRCSFTWKNVGCIKLFGNASAAQVGVYDIKIATVAYARIGNFKVPQYDTLEGYVLVVSGEASSRIIVEEQINIFPNPAIDGKCILASKTPVTSFTISDLRGHIVATKSTINENKHEIELVNAAKGVYIVTLESENKTYKRKIVF